MESESRESPKGSYGNDEIRRITLIFFEILFKEIPK